MLAAAQAAFQKRKAAANMSKNKTALPLANSTGNGPRLACTTRHFALFLRGIEGDCPWRERGLNDEFEFGARLTAVVHRSAHCAARFGWAGRVFGMAAGAREAVLRAYFDAGVALAAMQPSDAANAGALVAQFAVGVGVEHPVVAVQAQRVTGFLGRWYALQRNVGEDSDGRALVAVVLVGVLHTVAQHVQVRHGLQHSLFLEVRKQQQKLDVGVAPPDVRQRHSQRLNGRRKWRVHYYDVASLKQRLYGFMLTRQQSGSR